ncbi:MAG: ImmA/IrrE family metallo-endopeptidase [Deltaproteobacteria bacterium]|nr:ImmA/IrrE family metallo-endopeptidase [Deltaproteobacteria bacterium]
MSRFREDLGYTEAYVAHRLDVGVEDLRAIETGRTDPDSRALSVFSDLYGIELERLWTQDVEQSDSETLRLLFLRKQGPALAGRTRAAIARASLIARQFVELGGLLGAPSSYARLRESYRHEGEYQGLGQPWEIGEELGLRLRGDLELGREPVRSIRQLAEGQLGVLIISANIRSSDVAACSFSNERTGPVVVLNTAGENSRPWRWRFTVAHEICHLLFDELSQTELGSITGYQDQEEDAAADAVEKRANSFAISLLAPKEALRAQLSGMQSMGLSGQVRALMEMWGINFKAARLRMLHMGWASVQELEELSGVETMESEEWLTAEADLLDTFFPCPSVPEERRGAFARRVVRAYAAGAVSRNRLVSLLEASPDDALDQLVSLVAELDRE